MQWGSKARGTVGTLVGNLKAYAPLHATTADATWSSSFEDTNRKTNCLRGNPGIAVGIARDCIPSPCIRLKLTRYSLPFKERIVAIEGAAAIIGVGQGRHGACVDTLSLEATQATYRSIRVVTAEAGFVFLFAAFAA